MRTLITPRDTNILNTLFEIQLLTIPQMTRLFFPTEGACRNRLLRLRRVELLEEERPSPVAAPFFSILKLGKAAFKHLGYSYSKKASTVYLEHRIELNDLYVNLKSEGVLDDLKLFWQDGSNFTLSYEKTHFRPDARMSGESKNMIYLEYDRGTKNLPIVQENIAKYLAWFDQEELRTGALSKKIHLIYVTPKNSRALAIQRQFENACLKRDQMKPNNFLFHSLTTEAFLEQSKMILRSSNWGQLSLVNGGLGQTNQKTF